MFAILRMVHTCVRPCLTQQAWRDVRWTVHLVVMDAVERLLPLSGCGRRHEDFFQYGCALGRAYERVALQFDRQQTAKTADTSAPATTPRPTHLRLVRDTIEQHAAVEDASGSSRAERHTAARH